MANIAPVKSDMYAGSDKTLQVIVYSTRPAPGVAGVRQNITGWTFTWELRTSPEDTSAALIMKTSAALQITIADGPNGVVNVALLRADTVGLAPGTYHHTLSRTDAGNVDAVALGDFVIAQSDHH